MKKASWKDYLLSVIAVIAFLALFPRLKQTISGYVLFLQYAVMGLAPGAVAAIVLSAVRKGKLSLCLSGALFAAWLALPAEAPVMSGLLGCAAAMLLLSVPALAAVLAALPLGGGEPQRER